MLNQKKYTRKQIQEAISYWTKQLHLMDESRNALIDALEKEFGHDVVFSLIYDYVLSQEDCEKILNILNIYMFHNKQKLVDIFWWPEDKVVERLNQNAIESNEDSKPINAAKRYGVFSAVCKDVKDERGNAIDISITKKAILMNSSRLTACAFIFAVACICHELIHYYDSFTKEHHDKQLNAVKNNEAFDSHKDDVFQKRMHEANALGIDVVEKFEKPNTYLSVNKRARYKLYEIVGESEQPYIHTFGDDQNLFIKNDKTGTMFYAHFD